MAEFAVNVVTTAGLALIARATAASQLIYTRVLSDADAMTAAAAALATPADFSGPEGTILAASATDVSCRVVGRIGNQATAASVKTFAVCAKIDGDASDVVVAVLSDDAEIPIPDTSSPVTGVEIGFLLNIASADTVTVQVTGAGSVTFGDIARFVSCHKAGDPTTGEAQTILGDKAFSDDVDIAGGLGVTGDAVFADDVEINGGLVVDGAVTEEEVTVGKTLFIVGGQAIDTQDTVKIYQNYVTVGSDTAVRLYFGWPSLAADASQVLFDADVYVYGLEIMGALEAGSTAHFSGSTRFESTVEIEDDLTLNNGLYVGTEAYIDSNGDYHASNRSITVGKLYVGGEVELSGLAPDLDSSVLEVPIGGIIGACPQGVSGWGLARNVGETVTLAANEMPAAAWDGTNSRWGADSTGRTLPAGRYRLVTGWDYTGAGSAYSLVLLCRVE